MDHNLGFLRHTQHFTKLDSEQGLQDSRALMRQSEPEQEPEYRITHKLERELSSELEPSTPIM
jgi:hypothetical protein